MQLVAYGAQDVYLTGDPKVTFFQAAYKRYTNFAMEAIQQTLNGTLANNSVVSVTIGRMGDLVGDMFVQLTPLTNLAENTLSSPNTVWLAEKAISSVELTIGGQSIEKHYQTWWRLYAEVFLSESKKLNYGKMTSTISTSSYTSYVYLPLLFFFNRNPGLYLPMIALQYHDVRLDFTLGSAYQSHFPTTNGTFQVWANFVYLDTEERRRFSQKTHEYLIEQVQYNSDVPMVINSKTQKARLSISHPVKELIWCMTNSATIHWNFTYPQSSNLAVDQSVSAPTPLHAAYSVTLNNTSANPPLEEGDASTIPSGPIDTLSLYLNGQPRFNTQQGKYFNQYQPYQYHSGCPYAGIYVYSFALKPEEHQPSGTCNFSRIDNAEMQFNLKNTSIPGTLAAFRLFAVGYNVLRIQGGMGGLAFSN